MLPSKKLKSCKTAVMKNSAKYKLNCIMPQKIKATPFPCLILQYILVSLRQSLAVLNKSNMTAPQSNRKHLSDILSSFRLSFTFVLFEPDIQNY